MMGKRNHQQAQIIPQQAARKSSRLNNNSAVVANVVDVPAVAIINNNNLNNDNINNAIENNAADQLMVIRDLETRIVELEAENAANLQLLQQGDNNSNNDDDVDDDDDIIVNTDEGQDENQKIYSKDQTRILLQIGMQFAVREAMREFLDERNSVHSITKPNSKGYCIECQ